jgi:NAD(P)-dependent dehydrogenase (short-subunit alcohol dehydrogenase family)
VHQLTKAVAVECAPFGIRANAICPAAMPYTGFMVAGGMPADSLDQIAEGVGASHPLGKPITAEDCAEAALFLCSQRAGNLTGVLLPVDGGYVAR